MGGGTVTEDHPLRRLLFPASAVVVGVLVALAGWWLWPYVSADVMTPAVSAPQRGYNGQLEPAAAVAFVRAFHDKNPQGMRAAVTAQCVADQDAALCFGAERDATFSAWAATRSFVTIFIGVTSGPGPYKVARYDVTIHSQGHTGDYTMSITLNDQGRIVRVITDSVEPANSPTV